MNLDKLIKDYKECTLDEVFVEHVLDYLYELKTAYKPVVPQFVVDWYEEHKDDFDYSLWEYLVCWDSQEPSNFKTWIADGEKYEPLIILVNMHQFGYEVEEVE